MTPKMSQNTVTDVTALYTYNIDLLTQILNVIEVLQHQAAATFNYAQAVGPHLRHVIEHYSAFLHAIAQDVVCVDYDARDRNLAVQNVPAITLSKIHDLIDQFRALAEQNALSLDHPVRTRLKSGLTGEQDFLVASTIGRELLFLSSHTVHHFALVSRYCRDAGVDLGHDFGKAPSTIAFERRTD